MTTVLKLGGSVITDKDTPETVDHDALARAADAVANHRDLVLVHGGGSFGHHSADRHGITATEGSHDAAAARAVHAAMRRLNDAVVDALHGRGVPALPIHPLSVGTRDAAGRLGFPSGQAQTMLDEGFVPVLHGDVIAHEGKGVTIVSGDDLVVALAEALNADRVGLCSSEDGVLDADGEVIPRIRSLDDAAGVLGESDATDVTGGMGGKVETLLALDTPASVFGPSGLVAFLRGDDVGTRIE